MVNPHFLSFESNNDERIGYVIFFFFVIGKSVIEKIKIK